jgi:hypothetical protein
MSWEAYVQMLDDTTIAAAIISVEGALCAKSESFKATQKNMVHWTKMLKDPPLARQHGIEYGDQKLFALEFKPDYLHAMCDDVNIYMKKSNTVVVIGVCDQTKAQEDAKAAVLNLSKMLFDAGA